METVNEAIKIAKRFGLWLKIAGTWYTPKRFAYVFAGWTFDQLNKALIGFYNPEEELKKDHHMIIKWVREGKEPERIVSGLIKMFAFHEEIRRYYTPVPWTPDIHTKDAVIEEYRASPVPDRIVNDVS